MDSGVSVTSMQRPGQSAGGFTLTEILVATVVTSAAMWGTMTALTTAAQVRAASDVAAYIEADGYAMQAVEEVRNITPNPSAMSAEIAQGWHDVGFGGGFSSPLPNLQRMRCVRRQDCDGDGVAGDCYAIAVQVCWNGAACPAAGSSVDVCA